MNSRISAVARRRCSQHLVRRRRLCWDQCSVLRFKSTSNLVSAQKPWSELSCDQREAWKVLGWSQGSWDGDRTAPLTELKVWAELSVAERSAASHGLGYTQESWDKRLEAASVNLAMTSPRAQAPEPGSPSRSPSSGFVRSLLGLARTLVPVVRALAGSSPRFKDVGVLADVVSALDDAAVTTVHGGSIAVSGVEDVVYLDDSSSMAGYLHIAHSLWYEMAKRLQATPTRIIKFGTAKHVVMPRVESFSSAAVACSWNASSGGTYMWHMILEDVCSTYKPGPGRLRVFVITDGFDVFSPPPYQGMRGMDALMQDLLGKGFNIEFHIVFVSGSLLNLGETLTQYSECYRDLALATGGSFIHVSGSENEESRLAFLEGISQSNVEASRRRLEAMQHYEQRLKLGDGKGFSWYKRFSD